MPAFKNATRMLQAFWAKQENRLGALCLAILFIFSLLYFSPLLGGKVLPQGDVIRANGMAQDIKEHKQQSGQEPFWSESGFSGMPSMTIAASYSGNFIEWFRWIFFLGLPYPIGYFFLGMALFFGLLRAHKVPPFAALAGALGYGLYGYFTLIIEAGHYNKVLVMMTAPGVLWGMALVFMGKRWIGGIVFLLSLGMNLYYNHVQMTYYLAFLSVIYVLYQAIDSIVSKKLKSFAINAGMLVGLAVLALALNAAPLLPLYEYSKQTVRGPADLQSASAEAKAGGMSKEAAYAWSSGREELLTLMIPNAAGGNSQGTSLQEKERKTELYKELQKLNAAKAFPQLVGLSYWGPQQFTGGPFYIGAIIMFGFVLGAFLVRGGTKWALLYGMLVSLLLSLGEFSLSVGGSLSILVLPLVYWLLHKRFKPAQQPLLAIALVISRLLVMLIVERGKADYSLYDLLFEYLPLFNKFRVPSSIQVVAALAAPWLAALGFAAVADKKISSEERQRALYYAFGLTGGACLLLALMGGSLLGFEGKYDAEVAKQVPADVMRAIEKDRASLLSADAWRSFFLILVSAGLLWTVVKGYLKSTSIAFALLAMLILADLTFVNRRVLNSKSYERKKEYEVNFTPRKADAFVMKDTSYYRVYAPQRGINGDGFTPYFHNSIGGYNAAKLRRYDDLINRYLQPGRENSKVLNMLNTQYVIVSTVPDSKQFFLMMDAQDGEKVLLNKESYGPAWFTQKAITVGTPDEAFASLDSLHPRFYAVLEATDNNPQTIAQSDSLLDPAKETIQLVSHSNTKLVYKSSSPYARFAVFSEVYYPEGWTATIDDKETPILRNNYILRGLAVPAGEHTITFNWDPGFVRRAERISGIASVLSGLVLVAFVALLVREERRKKPVAMA